jgi:histidine kinase 2/3/4 (cytokinin receptor)
VGSSRETGRRRRRKSKPAKSVGENLVLMGLKMQQSHHHSVAVRLNEQMGTKRGYTFIQANRDWLPKFLLLWIMVMAFFSMMIYNGMDDDNKVRRKEILGSMCDQRARMLQDQFSVSVNHVHALAILVSTFHYYKSPSAIDQVCSSFPCISI